MKKTLVLIAFLAFLMTAWPNVARAQGGFQDVTATAGPSAMPGSFDVEKMPLAVQKPNSAVLKNAQGTVVVGLLDTTKSSARIRRKYSGMIVAQTRVSIGGISLAAGSYGFGLWAPAPPSTDNGRLTIYTKDGDEVGECPAKRGGSPKPLTVTTGKGGAIKLTFFGYSVDVQ
jgi:hypothetical protein